jgi:hypothetical protein
MEVEDPFNVVREQGHLDLVTLEIDYYFEKLEDRLNDVDFAGQRDQYESIARKYEDARPKPFFGVFAIESDSESESELVRVGKHTIHSEVRDALVHQWESKEASRYFQLEREGEGVYHAAVEIANGRVISVTETNADRAFRRRQRILQAKGERLHDIVELIRPEQDDIVRLDRKGGLVIQGGPGTGKTVVALQRLAYLIYEEQKTRAVSQPVLVVGPTASYVDYVRDFLPSLGHQNAINLDIRTLCLRRLSDAERTRFEDVREERDAMTRSKNTPQIVRLMRGLIWEPGAPKTIAAKVTTNRRPSSVRYVTAEFISAQISSIASRFNEDKISYNQARRELHQEIVRKLLSDQPSGEKSPAGRSLEARRDLLLENWLLKIGLHSQLERQRWRQILDTPAGGRYKRALAAVMADYYIADIEKAIDSIAERATLDSKVLRDALEAVEAPQKRGAAEDVVDESSTPDDELIELDEIDAQLAASALASGRLADLDKVINELLPNRNVLRISQAICAGDAKSFLKVLGAQGSEMAKRFKNEAVNKPGTKDYWWTSADLPIVAEISYLIDGNASTDDFFHLVIDEAQDLTTMQAKAVSRFISNGNVTVAGDVNQATRPASIGNWEKFFAELGIDDWDIRTLEHNYRVPENIYDYALTYLSEDDRIETPTCDLDGGEINLIEAELPNLAERLHEILGKISIEGERVAIISDMSENFSELLNSGYKNITALSAEDCKGLEVDHSIVVLPSRWFSGTDRMKRLMYVVLTRATKSVTIIQHEPERFGILTPQVEE